MIWAVNVKKGDRPVWNTQKKFQYMFTQERLANVGIGD